MWPFKRKIAVQFNPSALDLGENIQPFRVRTDNEAMNVLLYSQAVSLKRIADGIETFRLNVDRNAHATELAVAAMQQLPDQLQNAIQEAIWNATRKPN